jgi:uncharacterized protein
MTKHKSMLWIAGLAFSCVAFAAKPAGAQETTGSDEIRVLLTFGGHKFEEGPFFEMFDNMPGVRYTRAPLPRSAGLLTPALKKDYDVIVMYDMVTSISAEQQSAFLDLLRSGIGVVSLHHNIGAHRDWEEFTKVRGGKYYRPGNLAGDAVSSFTYNQDIAVKVADKTHPITRGIEDFRIVDEAYKNFETLPGIHVLLTTDHPLCDPEIAWTHQYGNSPVFCLLLGNDSTAWSHPAYPKLVLNGIRWAHAEAKARASGDPPVAHPGTEE